MKLNRNVAMALMSLALIGGGSGVALAADGGSSPTATDSEVSTEVEGTEGVDDQAAQDAACAAAGIDPAADNVNFDDETGECSLDNGADNGGGE